MVSPKKMSFAYKISVSHKRFNQMYFIIYYYMAKVNGISIENSQQRWQTWNKHSRISTHNNHFTIWLWNEKMKKKKRENVGIHYVVNINNECVNGIHFPKLFYFLEGKMSIELSSSFCKLKFREQQKNNFLKMKIRNPSQNWF